MHCTAQTRVNEKFFKGYDIFKSWISTMYTFSIHFLQFSHFCGVKKFEIKIILRFYVFQVIFNLNVSICIVWEFSFWKGALGKFCKILFLMFHCTGVRGSILTKNEKTCFPSLSKSRKNIFSLQNWTILIMTYFKQNSMTFIEYSWWTFRELNTEIQEKRLRI